MTDLVKPWFFLSVLFCLLRFLFSFPFVFLSVFLFVSPSVSLFAFLSVFPSVFMFRFPFEPMSMIR